MTYRVVVPVSGGKDSQACLKLALRHYPADEVRVDAPAQPLPAGDPRVSALRWLLNITTEFDRKDVRTRQAARLLDEFSGGDGRTNRELLEDLWAHVSGVTASEPAAWMHEYTDPHTGRRDREVRLHKPSDAELLPGDTLRPLAYADGVPAVEAPSLAAIEAELERLQIAAMNYAQSPAGYNPTANDRYAAMRDQRARVVQLLRTYGVPGLHNDQQEGRSDGQ